MTGTSSPAPADWLDRHPLVPLLILALAPLLGLLPDWLFGVSLNPIWTTSGAATGSIPGLIHGQSIGDPNIGWTTQALGHLAAEDWLHLRLPWWNPYNGIGLPLAGEIQPEAFFLPFVLLLALPAGIVWLQTLMQAMVGLATYALFRRLSLGGLAALAGGLLFAFNSVFAFPPHVGELCAMPFLPILLHGIEDARDEAHPHRAVILVALGIAFSILAGFPEAAYVNGLFALAWAAFRVVRAPRRVCFALRIAAGGFCGLAIAAPQLVAFADALLASGQLGGHNFGQQAIPAQGIAGILVPYVFGPLNDLIGSKPLYDIAGSTGHFIGLLPILAALFGLIAARDRRLAWFLGVWTLLCLGRLFGFPPIIAATNLIPGLIKVYFWRYATPIWLLPIATLAASGLDAARFASLPRALPLLVVFNLLVLSGVLAALPLLPWHLAGAVAVIQHAWYRAALAAAAAGLLLAALALYALRGETRRLAFASLLATNAIALFLVPRLGNYRAGTLDTAAISYLRTHLTPARAYSIGPILANYSAYFGYPDITYDYFPADLSFARYIHEHLAPEFWAHLPPPLFQVPFAPLTPDIARAEFLRREPAYAALAIRYLIAPASFIPAPTVAFPPISANAMAIPLAPGHAVTFRGTASAALAKLPAFTRIGILHGTYGNAANGTGIITICPGAPGAACASGRAPMRGSPDNGPFTVKLNHPVHLHRGEAFTITFAHRGGTNPDAVWAYITSSPSAVAITLPDGKPAPFHTPRLVFSAPRPPYLVRAWSDHLLSIWRLTNAAPFYTTNPACSLASPGTDHVTATCAAPARLTRRELYAAGWRATDNAAPVPLTSTGEVFQSVPLHKGINRLRFAFAPRYSRYAWIAASLGLLALLAEAARGLSAAAPRRAGR